MTPVQDLSHDASDLPESSTETAFVHIPVLSREVLEGLTVRSGGHYLELVKK